MWSEGVLVLSLCLLVGILGRNTLVAVAAAVLLLLRLGRLDLGVRWILDHGVTLGVLLLILALLAPVADDRITLRRFVAELATPSGVVAVVLSAGGAYLGRVGIGYLQASPQVLAGIIVGSLVGTLLLRGVPTGPLILAGATALLAQWVK